MRFAKLEIKSILALFLSQYDYELVHKNGEKVTELPEPYRDNLCVPVLKLCSENFCVVHMIIYYGVGSKFHLRRPFVSDSISFQASPNKDGPFVTLDVKYTRLVE